MPEKNIIRAALVQHPPVFLNLEASLSRAEKLIKEAAGDGAALVAFPETWLCGYPVWLDNADGAARWNDPGAKALFRILWENGVVKGGQAYLTLRDMAARHGVHLVMGCHERDGRTLYNTQFLFSANGRDVAVHRKLMPTYNEKMIWGRGDGSTLAPLDTEFGVLGGLICWEHWMPLARAAMHAQGELVHVAQWPSVIELHQIASRHYAFEGQCFVLACGTVLSKKEVLDGFDSLKAAAPEAREMLDSVAGPDDTLLMTGGSAVIGPDAAYITQPVVNRSAIIFGDLDPAAIRESAMVMDTDGHYARPDVFSLAVDRRPRKSVMFTPE